MKKSILVLISSFLFIVLLLEFFVRFQFRDEVDTTRLRKIVSSTRISSFTRPSDNKDIVYEFIPNIRVRWKGVTIASSADGCCRVSARSLDSHQYDPGSFKLAIIGDSTAFGWRVEYEETYAYLLKEKLEKELGRRVELHNYSLPGYNSHQLLAVFEERVASWRPDLTILHYDHNDADPILEKPPNYIPPEYGDNILHSALLKFIVRRIRYQYNKNLSTVVGSAGKRNGLDKVYRNYYYDGPQYRQHLNNLDKLANIARIKDIPIVCFIFNTFEELHDNINNDKMYVLLHKPLVPKLRAMGYYVIDSYPSSQEVFRQRRWTDWRATWFSENDAHPNKLGHIIIANMIFANLPSEILKYNRSDLKKVN